MMRSVFFILLPFIFSNLAAQQLEMNIRHPADNDTLNRARTRLSAECF